MRESTFSKRDLSRGTCRREMRRKTSQILKKDMKNEKWATDELCSSVIIKKSKKDDMKEK